MNFFGERRQAQDKRWGWFHLGEVSNQSILSIKEGGYYA